MKTTGERLENGKLLNHGFPNEVFEDIKGSDFKKYNKKGVSEDFVTENFKELGWSCYRPFDDTGIDLVIRKNVCPQGHTRWNEKPIEKCKKCPSDLIPITRFIQIKAREEKDGKIGITLDSKDFRGDPRHVFLIYADAKDDFFIIPIYSYLRTFQNHKGLSRMTFGNPSFRRGNNRVYYKKNSKERYVWTGGGSCADLHRYMNTDGVEIISNPSFDTDLDDFVKKISKMRLDILHGYSSGEELKPLLENEEEQIKEAKKTRKTIIANWRSQKPGDNKKVLFKKKTKAGIDIENKEKIMKQKNLKLEKDYQDLLDRKTTKTPDAIAKMRVDNRKKFLKKNKRNSELIKTVNDSWLRYKGQKQL